MATRLRALNNTGIGRFRDYLATLRSGATSAVPRELLEDDALTRELPVDVSVEPRVFESRLELGVYLVDTLQPLGSAITDRDIGLWAWLSLLFFDQVCPDVSDRGRQPGHDYRHIPHARFLHSYRHLLYGPYQVYRRHGDNAKLLLTGPANVNSRISQEITGRQDFIANPGVVDATRLLYFDGERAAPKRGATTEQPGAIRRFVRVLQQLDLTYDIFGLTGEQILELLPREFDAWRQAT